MSLEMAYQTLVNAAILGVIYSLVALGYVIVYRASRVFNFLQAQFMYFGALLFTTLWSGNGLAQFLLSLLLGTVVVGIGSWAIYVLIVQRTAAQPHWIQMLLTMFLGLACVNIAQLIWAPTPRSIGFPLDNLSWQLPGGAVLTRTDFMILVVGAALSAVLYWLLTVSPLGVRLRATAENPTLAAYSGMRLGFWIGMAWALAAAAAVVAGVSFGLRVPVDTSITHIGLMAFPAAMIGGMDSIKGCFLGAMVLALVQQFATVTMDAQAGVAVGFAAVLIVLVVRPRGFFGAPIVDRV
jgi:branched-chain amino acid transport system permease protein